jgi:hypothetical protein
MELNCKDIKILGEISSSMLGKGSPVVICNSLSTIDGASQKEIVVAKKICEDITNCLNDHSDTVKIECDDLKTIVKLMIPQIFEGETVDSFCEMLLTNYKTVDGVIEELQRQISTDIMNASDDKRGPLTQLDDVFQRNKEQLRNAISCICPQMSKKIVPTKLVGQTKLKWVHIIILFIVLLASGMVAIFSVNKLYHGQHKNLIYIFIVTVCAVILGLMIALNPSKMFVSHKIKM